ncbi:hypothetical protein MRX96_028589 [Rhipicephalus microplus]
MAGSTETRRTRATLGRLAAPSTDTATLAMLTYPESTDIRKRRVSNWILCSYVAPVFLSPMLALSDNQVIAVY